MNKRVIAGLIKHGDFILLDVVLLQLCYVVSYWINVKFANPYDAYRYRYQALVMLAAQVLVILFSNNYHGILRRTWPDEIVSVLTYIGEVFVVSLVYLFAVHWVGLASRLQMGITCLLFFGVDFLLRQANKRRIRKRAALRGQKKSLVLVTSRSLVHDTIKQLSQTVSYQGYFVSHVVLLDGIPRHARNMGELEGVPLVPLDAHAIASLTHGWVDEVFILQPDDQPFPTKFMDDLMEMGMTVSYAVSGTRFSVVDTGKVGPYAVLTSKIREVSTGQLMIKRLADILGGLIGCLLTLLIFLIIGPIIYVKSPGPIFFKQTRVGRNGKPFTMYKFRSMYMDAEKRKKELEEQNKIEGGMMFKMDDDPRIIGSEKKDKNGRPCGIGNFIRNTSIDEFPQFWNVLKGEMSLVGTRPPTLDEWNKYDLHHRVRMSIKPGITGLWQISGRSNIVDFEEVVRLDREYIQNWSLELDLRILLKTVSVVLRHDGAS